jgi:hypothetical protein
MNGKLELNIPLPLKEVFQWCAVYCEPACCGLDAFDMDASLIYGWFHHNPGHRGEELLEQLDHLIAAVATHTGPVDSTDELKFDFGHEWPSSEECVAYLQTWRTELVRATGFDADVLELPDTRLAEAQRHGETELQIVVHRIVSDARILLYKGNTKTALHLLAPIAALDDSAELTARAVRIARELLAEHASKQDRHEHDSD